jgi:DNA-binding beta-propeller fold protein YncE
MMKKSRRRKNKISPIKFLATLFGIVILISLVLFISFCFRGKSEPVAFTKVTTFSGIEKEFGEPFGIVAKNGKIYLSDGENGKIFSLDSYGKTTLLTDKLDTPSQIAIDKDNNLIVADSGSHTIKKISANGEIITLAGTENKSGDKDGEANQALFNAPIGVAISGEKIYVADTYNDKIRLIENGKVSTFAGSEKGYSDKEKGKFDTPSGLAIWKDESVIVADTGNRRIRRIEKDGKVSTLAGNGEQDLVDDLPSKASFVEPIAVTTDERGIIYIADGNTIRAIGRRFFPFVETITASKRGFADGKLLRAKFNRPSGLAVDENNNLFVADAENQVVRVLTGGNWGTEITAETIEKLRVKPEDFRKLGEPHWTYNPPQNKREIAGTLGEVRGEINEGKNAWFHNGLDIVGGYGETARFIRDEKVLRPIATQNFGGLRELLRMPTLGYIHIRLGRDKDDKQFEDNRFQFEKKGEKISGVRVARGTKFKAGDEIGTLNSLNHVHLIAGRSGWEMNALDALIFPDVADSRPPKIEEIKLYTQNWQPISEKVNGKTRIVVRAFDQMDGNAERRKLGIYSLNYQVLKQDGTPIIEAKTNIKFDRMPDEDAVRLVYAKDSKSGATGETIFNYIATNEVHGDIAREDFLDTSKLESGNYILRIFVADYFGNTTTQDVGFEK